VAAAITGVDLAAIERLPDTSGLERRVAVQAGHLINFGGLVSQTVALAGAEVVPIGSAALAETWHLDSALNEGLAATLYVISHHTVREGELAHSGEGDR
jgi:L-seryl-tRNA(Ser) seleniumtransferase